LLRDEKDNQQMRLFFFAHAMQTLAERDTPAEQCTRHTAALSTKSSASSCQTEFPERGRKKNTQEIRRFFTKWLRRSVDTESLTGICM